MHACRHFRLLTDRQQLLLGCGPLLKLVPLDALGCRRSEIKPGCYFSLELIATLVEYDTRVGPEIVVILCDILGHND